jgi:hypothetical protein
MSGGGAQAYQGAKSRHDRLTAALDALLHRVYDPLLSDHNALLNNSIGDVIQNSKAETHEILSNTGLKNNLTAMDQVEAERILLSNQKRLYASLSFNYIVSNSHRLDPLPHSKSILSFSSITFSSRSSSNSSSISNKSSSSKARLNNFARISFVK